MTARPAAARSDARVAERVQVSTADRTPADRPGSHTVPHEPDQQGPPPAEPDTTDMHPSSSGTPSNELIVRLAARRSVVAVALLFSVNGLIIGGYGGALPSIRERLGITTTDIAILLFTAGLAAIAAMQIGGRLSDSIGARQVALAALPLLIGAAVTFAFATGFPVAVLGAVLLGLGNGSIDVAMNAIGVQVEAARKRPIMSTFHALWSVGGFVGAGSVLILSALFQLDGAAIVMPLMLLLAGVAVAAFAVAIRITPPTAVVEHTVDGVRTKIPAIAWLLALMAVAFGLSEGTATDWAALHVTEVARVDSTTGALGLVAVSGFMVVIRLFGDRLVARFGRRSVVRFGAACAAIGYAMVTLVSGLPLLLAGWALVGLGVGMIAPQVYAVATSAAAGSSPSSSPSATPRSSPDPPSSDSWSTTSACITPWPCPRCSAPASSSSPPPCPRRTTISNPPAEHRRRSGRRRPGTAPLPRRRAARPRGSGTRSLLPYLVGLTSRA